MFIQQFHLVSSIHSELSLRDKGLSCSHGDKGFQWTAWSLFPLPQIEDGISITVPPVEMLSWNGFIQLKVFTVCALLRLQPILKFSQLTFACQLWISTRSNVLSSVAAKYYEKKISKKQQSRAMASHSLNCHHEWMPSWIWTLNMIESHLIEFHLVFIK